MEPYGRYEEYLGRRHFVPALLTDLPEIALTGELPGLFGEAMNGIGQAEALSKSLPYPQPLIRACVTKEALLSSEIEGTIATLTEVMEAQSRNRDPENRDVRDVLKYIEATDAALRMLNEEKLPLVERVIREAHRVLLDSPAGEGKTPGEYRRVSVSVGRHVPPAVPELMRDLERFLNAAAQRRKALQKLPPGRIHEHSGGRHEVLDRKLRFNNVARKTALLK